VVLWANTREAPTLEAPAFGAIATAGHLYVPPQGDHVESLDALSICSHIGSMNESSALSNDAGVRDSIEPILRAKGILTEDQERIVQGALHGDPEHRGHYMNHTEQPSGPTVLLIMALVQHIERLEARIGRVGRGLSDELMKRAPYSTEAD